MSRKFAIATVVAYGLITNTTSAQQSAPQQPVPRAQPKLFNGADTVTTVAGPVLGMELPGNRVRLTVDHRAMEMAVSSLSDLLSGRFAGVQVLTPGATGMASRIRIRGQSSLALDNAPLIIVDGVRLFRTDRNDNQAILSRIDDININEIATIDLLSGPAGTAMYGPDASNGVINIATKRGTVGRAHVTAYGEGGLITDPNEYPDQWALWGKANGSNVPSLCTLTTVSARTCTADSLVHGSVMSNSTTSPIEQSYRNRFGANVSGGVQRFQYFVSAQREDETGVFRMPQFEIDRLKTERNAGSIPDDQLRPSARLRNNVRANLSAQLVSWLNLDVASAYVSGDARFVISENNENGIWANALGGPWNPSAVDANNVPLRGYWRSLPGDIMSRTNSENVDRYLNTFSVKAHPWSWLTASASFAKDDGTQDAQILERRGEGLNYGTGRVGFLNTTKTITSNKTLTGSATASFKPQPWLATSTSVGAQSIRSELSNDSRSYFELAPGASTPSTPPSAITINTLLDRTRALFATEMVSFHDELFLTAGLRREQPRFTGANGDAMLFHNVGASWTLSRREFMKRATFVDMLRLRAAYGTAPRYATGFDAQYAILRQQAGGTARVKNALPETSAELEFGADASLSKTGSQLAFTYYNKRTRDVFVPFVIPSVLGNTRYPLMNGALVRNRGFEVTLDQQLVNASAFSASVVVTTSRNSNRLVELLADVSPVDGGNRTTLRSLQDYPLFGFWQFNYRFNDTDGNGIIVPAEVTLSDTLAYLGSSIPTNELAVTPHIELMNHRLRISAQIDRKWGFRKFNNTLRHQCQAALACRGVADKSASLDEQAAAALARVTNAGFIEDGAFTRVRELAVAYTLPSAFARAVRAQEWNVVLTGRNLGVSTNYSGVDPESVMGSTDQSSDEYFSTPPMRYFTLRLNVKF